MQLKRVTTHPRRIKRLYAGGPKARAIYAPGGLAAKLRAAREHNTADRTMSVAGRPPANEDGTRTYRLALPGSTGGESPPSGDDSPNSGGSAPEPGPETRCPHCGEWDPGFIDANFDGCPVTCEGCGHNTTLGVWRATADDADVLELRCHRCGCEAGSLGMHTYGDHCFPCFCSCHEGAVDAEEGLDIKNDPDDEEDETVLYRGERGANTTYSENRSRARLKSFTRVTKNGEQLPCREDVLRIGQLRDWGPAATRMSRDRLALDLCCDVLGDADRAIEVYQLVSRTLIAKIPVDDWQITAEKLRRGIEAIEAAQDGEVHR